MKLPRIVGIDPGLRHTAVVSVTVAGFEWKLLNTAAPDPAREKFAHEAVYRDQVDAAALSAALRRELVDGSVRMLACELATHARDARAAAAMFITRGVVASIQAEIRGIDVQVFPVLPDHVKDACGIDRYHGQRAPRLLTEEDRAALAKAKAVRAKYLKLKVERHVLDHFPELVDVERLVGKALKNHVFDAVAVLIAALRQGKLRSGVISDEMHQRFLDAHAAAPADVF